MGEKSMKNLFMWGFCVTLLIPVSSFGDLVLDNFENDRSHMNGDGTDVYWNPPFDPTFIPSTETQNVFEGNSALKVTWDNKGLYPAFSINHLNINGNNGALFDQADAVRMRIAGDGGRIIMKLSDVNGFTTGDVSDVNTSGNSVYSVFEFPFFETVVSRWPDMDLKQIAEMSLLIDAGNLGSSGEIYIDSIELILGSGDTAQVVGVIDNFDNDSSIDDDPNQPDSEPGSYSAIAQQFSPYQFSVVDNPTDSNNAVLKIDYNTSPWNVIFISRLDVNDWSQAHSVSIDVYGSVRGLLMKLQYEDLSESSDLPPALQNHDGDQWNTLTWTMNNVATDKLKKIRSLLFFVEGPSGGIGSIFVDNLTLKGAIAPVKQWALF
jgi:hypothetical protein